MQLPALHHDLPLRSNSNTGSAPVTQLLICMQWLSRGILHFKLLCLHCHHIILKTQNNFVKSMQVSIYYVRICSAARQSWPDLTHVPQWIGHAVASALATLP